MWLDTLVQQKSDFLSRIVPNFFDRTDKTEAAVLDYKGKSTDTNFKNIFF